MSHSAHVAAARELSRRKLHDKIDKYEEDETRTEPNRITPFKIATAIATAGEGMTCAGRNSLNRYLRATGFSGVEVETTKKTKVYGFRNNETKYIMSHSVMKLPVKIPGKGKLGFVMVPILDKNPRIRDIPITLSEDKIPHVDDCFLYPLVSVPKTRKVYDLFPFPAEGDCYDEGQTRVYTNELSKEDIEKELEVGIVRIVFLKLNGEERTMRGTTNKGFIPTRLHARSNEVRQGREDQIVVFDIDIQSWRSCRFSSILQLSVRLHPYDTFPGTAQNLEEFVNQQN